MFLSRSQTEVIDEALSTSADVRLVVQNGHIRFVVMQNRHDALRWQPDPIIIKESGRRAGGPRRPTAVELRVSHNRYALRIKPRKEEDVWRQTRAGLKQLEINLRLGGKL